MGRSGQATTLFFSPPRIAARAGGLAGGARRVKPGAITVVLRAAAVAVALSSAPSSADMFHPGLTSNSYNSDNWAGYVVEPASPQDGTATAVSGSWIVPAVTAPANSGGELPDVVTWVGIDGFGNSTVEQVGTEAYTLNGTTFYYDAWFEMYPLSMVSIFAVHPGDKITASVQDGVPGYPGQFQLSLTDNTTGKNFTYYKTNSSALLASAEWIAEAPTGPDGILPLPTFGSLTFTGASATIGSTTGAIDDPSWQLTQVDMNNTTWGDVMTPSGITTVGSGSSATSSFTVVQTPEPSALACLAAAIAVLAFWRKGHHSY